MTAAALEDGKRGQKRKLETETGDENEGEHGPVNADDGKGELVLAGSDYMKFYRAGKNPKKLPENLKGMFTNLASKGERALSALVG